MTRTLKPRKCKSCGNVFQRRTSTQTVCGPKCAEVNAAKVRAQKEARAAKVEKKSMRDRMEKAKTRGEHLRELQTAFNQWIRLRDARLPCISCGRPATWKGQWDAGHFRSVGSNPSTRFDPMNVNKQCGPCNVHLSGNLIAYRVILVKKIGLKAVERLEGPHAPLKLTVPEIIAMKAEYRAKVRELRKEVEVNQTLEIEHV